MSKKISLVSMNQENQKIKIVLFVHGLSGGVGEVLINYFSHMPHDYTLDLITLNIESAELKAKFEKNGMRVIKIPSKKDSIIKNMLAMDRILKQNNYDIAYAHMTLTNCFPLYIAKKNKISTRISHAHLTTGNKNICEKILSWLTCKYATNYLACGYEAGKYLYGNRKFKVIKNAIDLNKYKFNALIRKKERKELKISDETTVIGHVGRFDEQKNHVFLLRMFKEYHEINPNSVLMLIGDGELKSKIKKLTIEFGLKNSVLFLGQIEDVYNKLQAMDIFVLPSLFEGLSIAAIEAQASGLSCLFSDTISPETAVTKNVIFKSLKDNSKAWANTLDSLNKKLYSRDTQSELKMKGYDISTEAIKLDQYFKKIRN